MLSALFGWRNEVVSRRQAWRRRRRNGRGGAVGEHGTAGTDGQTRLPRPFCPLSACPFPLHGEGACPERQGSKVADAIVGETAAESINTHGTLQRLGWLPGISLRRGVRSAQRGQDSAERSGLRRAVRSPQRGLLRVALGNGRDGGSGTAPCPGAGWRP